MKDSIAILELALLWTSANFVQQVITVWKEQSTQQFAH